MRTKFFLTISVVILGSLVAGWWQIASHLTSDADLVAKNLSLEPGYGINVSDAKLYDRPMAYALYVSAAIKMGKISEARIAADWLLQNTAEPTKAGWGLTEAWDAFGDGSKNPTSTVYGITDAVVVNGLFDIYDATRDIRYLNAAIRTLKEYEAYFELTEDGGYFWYSDQPSDRIDTPNVSAMLMGQYARAAHVTSIKSFSTIAQLAHAHFIANHKTIGDAWYWDYALNFRSDSVNDLVHHALIIKGMMDYAHYLGESIGIKEALNYLAYFPSGKTINQFPQHAGVSSQLPIRPARAWGIGMLIYIETRARNPINTLQAVRALREYKTDRAGVYGQFPGQVEWLPDMQAYVLYGLAEYQAVYGGINIAR